MQQQMRIATSIMTTTTRTVSTSNSFTEKFQRFQTLGAWVFWAIDIGYEATLLTFSAVTFLWVVWERLFNDDSILAFTPSFTACSFFQRFYLTCARSFQPAAKLVSTVPSCLSYCCYSYVVPSVYSTALTLKLLVSLIMTLAAWSGVFN